MIAAAVLLFASAAGHRDAGEIGAGEIGAGEIVARLRAEPAEVEVGEPCRWILEVEHPAGTTVRLPGSDPIPDDSWVLLEPRRVVRPSSVAGSSSEADGRVSTTATWRVLSLDAGERTLPAFQIDVGDSTGTRKVEVNAGSLHVRPALAPGEDAPRPMRGFRPAPEATARSPWRIFLVGLLLLAALTGGLVIWRRARRKPVTTVAPTPLDRLAELQRVAAEDPEASRRVVYGLSRLLRGSIDAFVRTDRAALVDSEWTAHLEPDERVPLGVRRSTARILRDSERIKYALHSPTRFALEEMLADARNALEALASAPPPAPEAPRASEEAA